MSGMLVPTASGYPTSLNANESTVSWRFKTGDLNDKVRGLAPTFTRNDTADVRRVVRKRQKRTVHNYILSHVAAVTAGWNPAAMTVTDVGGGSTPVVINGQTYTVYWRDVRIQGTPTGGNLMLDIYPLPSNTDTGIRRGQTVNASIFASVVNGTQTGVTGAVLEVDMRDSGGTYTETVISQGFALGSGELTAASRVSKNGILTNSNSVKVANYFRINFLNTSTGVDITVRVGGAQLTLGPALHPPIAALGNAGDLTYDIDAQTGEAVLPNTPFFQQNSLTGACQGLLMQSGTSNKIPSSQLGCTTGGPAPNLLLQDVNEVPRLFPDCVVNKHMRDSGSGDTNVGYPNQATVLASTTYRASGWVWIPSGVTITGVSLAIESGTWSFVSSLNADLSKRDQWQQIWGTYTSGGAQTTGVAVFRLTASTGAYFYSTHVQVTASNYPRPDNINFGAGIGSSGQTVCSVPVSSIPNFSTTQGTLIFRGGCLEDNTTNQQYFVSLSDGTFNNAIRIDADAATNVIRAVISSGGVTQGGAWPATSAYSLGTTVAAVTWIAGVFKFYALVAGVPTLIATSSAGTVPTGMTTLYIGGSPTGAANEPMLIESLDYVPVALSAAEVTARMAQMQ
jgi:hypothetical protein